MLVGVCCECQTGGKPLRFERGRALIGSHNAFGSFCEGSGTEPQATYQDSSGSDQMPEGVQVVIGNGPVCPDDFEREEHNRIQDRIFEREQAKENEKFTCCFDPWCNHQPDPPKPPGVFGTIGDLILAAKNGKQKTKKRG